MLSFFPRDVLDEIWDLIGSVSEGFPADFSNAGAGYTFYPLSFRDNSVHNKLGPFQTRPVANSAHEYRKVPFCSFHKGVFLLKRRIRQ